MKPELEDSFGLVRLPGYLVISRGSGVVVSFDRCHRPFHAFFRGRTFRIGLDGRVVEVRHGGPDALPTATPLSEDDREALFRRIDNLVEEMLKAPDEQFNRENEDFLFGEEGRKELGQIRSALVRDERERQRSAFRRLYDFVPILPPDCYRSLLVQVTEGCSYNRCRFCSLYQKKPFRIRDVKEFAEHVRSVLAFQGEAMERWTSIFLGDANALVVPHKRLVEMIRKLRRELQRGGHTTIADTLYSFSDASKPMRNLEQLRELRSLGLRRVYLGLETGCWGLRSELKKPGTRESITSAIHLLKEAEIGVGLILLAGAGGKTHSDQHVDDSIQFISEVKLDKQDIVYISPLHTGPDTPQAEEEPLSEEEIWEQAHYFVGALRKSGASTRPKVAIYDVARFVY